MAGEGKAREKHDPVYVTARAPSPLVHHTGPSFSRHSMMGKLSQSPPTCSLRRSRNSRELIWPALTKITHGIKCVILKKIKVFSNSNHSLILYSPGQSLAGVTPLTLPHQGPWCSTQQVHGKQRTLRKTFPALTALPSANHNTQNEMGQWQ